MDKGSYNKEYYKKNRDKIRLQQKSYQITNQENISKRKKKNYDLNPEPKKEITRKYYKKNRFKILENKKQYHKDNKKKIKETDRKYYLKNMVEIKRKNKEYIKNKLKNNKNFRLLQSLRTRTRNAILSNFSKKHTNTLDLIGCSMDSARKYLESKFKQGMTWDNYGKLGWNIDHIRPCSSFDLSDPEQQKQCFHYSNLQPLWWWENLEKGNKIIDF
jgi:hypothetical protein